MATEREREEQEERRSDARAWAAQADSRFASTAIKLPTGFTSLKLRTPKMLINILEYRASLGNPPLIHRGKGPKSECDEGYLHYELTYEVHRVPTPDNFGALYCCLWWNWNQPCPICDWLRDNNKTQDPELIKNMKPQTRHLWNAIDLDSRDQKVQVLDTNHYNKGAGFGEQIKKAISAVSRYADFARYDAKGYDLALTVDDQPMGGGRKYQAATRIDFLPRTNGWDKSILKECCQLEDCLIHYQYDELKALFLQQKVGDAPRSAEAEPERGRNTREEEPRRRDRIVDEPRQEETRRDRREAVQDPPPRREELRQDRMEESRSERERPAQRQEEPARRREEPAPRQEEVRREEPKSINKPETAAEAGLKLHDKVTHPKFGDCEIVRISPDGTSLTIEEIVDGIEHRAIAPFDVVLIGSSKPAEAPPPKEEAPPPKEEAPPPKEEAPPVRENPPARETAPAEPDRPRSRRDDDDFDRPRKREEVSQEVRRSRRDD